MRDRSSLSKASSHVFILYPDTRSFLKCDYTPSTDMLLRNGANLRVSPEPTERSTDTGARTVADATGGVDRPELPNAKKRRRTWALPEDDEEEATHDKRKRNDLSTLHAIAARAKATSAFHSRGDAPPIDRTQDGPEAAPVPLDNDRIQQDHRPASFDEDYDVTPGPSRRRDPAPPGTLIGTGEQSRPPPSGVPASTSDDIAERPAERDNDQAFPKTDQTPKPGGDNRFLQLPPLPPSGHQYLSHDHPPQATHTPSDRQQRHQSSSYNAGPPPLPGHYRSVPASPSTSTLPPPDGPTSSYYDPTKENIASKQVSVPPGQAAQSGPAFNRDERPAEQDNVPEVPNPEGTAVRTDSPHGAAAGVEMRSERMITAFPAPSAPMRFDIWFSFETFAGNASRVVIVDDSMGFEEAFERIKQKLGRRLEGRNMLALFLRFDEETLLEVDESDTWTLVLERIRGTGQTKLEGSVELD